MNTAIEMHDSYVNLIDVGPSGGGSVLLEAYVHRSHKEPGRSNGEGGVQFIRLTLADMAIEGEVGELPTYLYEGSLTIGEDVQDNMVPFPAKHEGAIRLYMMLAEDARVVIVTGTSVVIESEGEFSFVETFEPSPSSRTA